MRSEFLKSAATECTASHPCDRNKSQEWGTGHFCMASGGEAGPSAMLRSAQDDSL